MPTTTYNITAIKNVLGNYSVQQILDALNEVNMIVYSKNLEYNKKISPTTGFPPFLATTAGTYQYDCPADCRETVSIFKQRNVNTYNYGLQYSKNRYYKFNSVEFERVAITTTPPLYGSVATVTFVDDPGTTTEVYYHEYYKKPTVISSVDIPLDFPEEVHWLVRKAVIAMLSDENYSGNSMDFLNIIKAISKEIQSVMNRGAQGKSHQVNWQMEFKDGENI